MSIALGIGIAVLVLFALRVGLMTHACLGQRRVAESKATESFAALGVPQEQLFRKEMS